MINLIPASPVHQFRQMVRMSEDRLTKRIYVSSGEDKQRDGVDHIWGERM